MRAPDHELGRVWLERDQTGHVFTGSAEIFHCNPDRSDPIHDEHPHCGQSRTIRFSPPLDFDVLQQPLRGPSLQHCRRHAESHTPTPEEQTSPQYGRARSRASREHGSRSASPPIAQHSAPEIQRANELGSHARSIRPQTRPAATVAARSPVCTAAQHAAGHGTSSQFGVRQTEAAAQDRCPQCACPAGDFRPTSAPSYSLTPKPPSGCTLSIGPPSETVGPGWNSQLMIPEFDVDIAAHVDLEALRPPTSVHSAGSASFNGDHFNLTRTSSWHEVRHVCVVA